MTTDERIEHIRRVLPLSDCAYVRDACRFLLAELDAARVREAILRKAALGERHE